MKNYDKAYLRKTAGLPYLNEGVSKIKTLNIETRVLQEFGSLIRALRSIKEEIKNPERAAGSYRFGAPPIRGEKFNDESGDVDKQKLYQISMEKIDLIKEIIEECFSSPEEKEEEYDDEDGDEEEEYGDEDFDEYDEY